MTFAARSQLISQTHIDTTS